MTKTKTTDETGATGQRKPVRYVVGTEGRTLMVTPELALELERRVGPVGALSKRIYNADFQVKDIHSIIHVALLGGGMDADEAMRVMTPMFATLP